MARVDSLKARYGAPATRAAPYLFLRDRHSEKSDGLAVAGKLVCPGWTKPVPDQRRDELAGIAGRLLEARRAGWLGPLASWVDATGIRAFDVQSLAWLRRQAVDALVIPIRVQAAGAGFMQPRGRLDLPRAEVGSKAA
jgi:hypothetical protein